MARYTGTIERHPRFQAVSIPLSEGSGVHQVLSGGPPVQWGCYGYSSALSSYALLCFAMPYQTPTYTHGTPSRTRVYITPRAFILYLLL